MNVKSSLISYRALLFAVLVMPGVALAQNSPTVTDNMNQVPPPLSSLNANQVAGNYQRCMQQANMFQAAAGASSIMSQLNAGASRSTTGTSGLNSEDCSSNSASDTVPDSTPDCSLFESSPGIYDPKQAQLQENQVKNILAVISCKENKLAGVKAEISCLTTQAQLINNQIQQMQQPLLQKFQQMQQDMTTLGNELTNRKSQLDDTNLKLNGSPSPNMPGANQSAQSSSGSIGTGSAGLLIQQGTTQQLVQGMQNDIAQIQQMQTVEAQLAQTVTTQAADRTMALAASCFENTAVPGFQCKLPGAAVNPAESPMNYLLCRYQQNVTQLSSNGVVQTNNALLQAQGNQQYSALQSLLTEIMGLTPQSNSIPIVNPSAGPQITADADQGATILTAADVETQFGTQLASMNAAGINVHDFVMKWIGSCFQKATNQVAAEQLSSSSSLGQAEASVQAKLLFNQNQADLLMKKYNQVWSDDMKALTGQSAPLNLTNCIDQQPQIQLACLNDIENNMNGLLNGTTTNSAIQMTIQGTQSQSNITFTCNGLNGCAASLQNLATNLARETQVLGQYQKTYVTQANQGVDQFLSQMRQALSPQSAALQSQLQSINTQLATLGVGQGLDIQAIDGSKAQLTTDPNTGLYQTPTNLLALIGSGTTPPLLDVSGNNFSSALGGIATEISTEQSNMAKATNYQQQVVAKATGCRQTDIQNLAQNVQNDAQQLQTLQCGSNYQWCSTNDNPGKVEGLSTDIGNALSPYNVGTTISSIQGILSGAGGTCTTTTQNVGSDLDTVQGVCSSLPNCAACSTPRPSDSSNPSALYNWAGAIQNCTTQSNSASTNWASLNGAVSDLKTTTAAANASCTSIYSTLNGDKNTLVQDINRMTAGGANN